MWLIPSALKVENTSVRQAIDLMNTDKVKLHIFDDKGHLGPHITPTSWFCRFKVLVTGAKAKLVS
jgi:hypothetical protein